ncbi:unnamed protein product [Merluccius merluccius]
MPEIWAYSRGVPAVEVSVELETMEMMEMMCRRSVAIVVADTVTHNTVLVKSERGQWKLSEVKSVNNFSYADAVKRVQGHKGKRVQGHKGRDATAEAYQSWRPEMEQTEEHNSTDGG